jgi:hypothetical protein
MRGIRGATQTEARTVQSMQDGVAVACRASTAWAVLTPDQNCRCQLGAASAGRLP